MTAGLLLLAQATALKVLRTNLSTITPVLGLRHLLVDGAHSCCQSLFKMLPLFKSLETLSLNCYCDPGAVCFPALHLEGLQQLRSVELYRVLPSSIRLREGCELHVSISGRLTPFERFPQHQSPVSSLACCNF